MLRNPNLTLEDIAASNDACGHDGAASNSPLVGPRPGWWWTGLSPEAVNAPTGPGGRIVALPMPNTSTCTRKEVFDYFANGWLLNEVLFSGLRGEEAFMCAPYHGLRHPLVFYYGHTATLFVNKLRFAGLLDAPVNDYFERVFEVGVDEMSWDDMSKNEMSWPGVEEVNQYRRQVFELVADLIATHPGLADGHAPVTAESSLWALFMAMEHERIHFETSSVLIRELPLRLVQRPAAWPSLPDARAEQANVDLMVQVPAAEIRIGKPSAWPSYGWDNEYGSRNAKVGAFAVSQYMITNGQYLEFVKDGGYQRQQFWTENGWKWRSFRNTKWPTFWVVAGPAGLHEYKLRTIFDVIDLPMDWPVCVNFHEAKAYLAWKSERDKRAYRLPTEAEHVHLRRGTAWPDAQGTDADPAMCSGSMQLRETRQANLNLAFASEGSVRWSAPGPFGVHDIAGNLWDWCEDDFHPLDGFHVDALYDDFSTPCFDGEHKMILGGSFISTGDEASVWARFHFRPHFFQHAGFHAVVSENANATSAVHIHGSGSAKYENKSVMDQYLLFHYGALDKSVPATMAASEIGNFPQRCANTLIDLAKRHGCAFDRALDVGCAVGAATFGLARAYSHVTGVDISAQFVDAAESLRRGDVLPYQIVVEGNIRESAIAAAPEGLSLDRIAFRRADACSLPSEYAGFDAVLASNLLCRLPSPKAFLSRLGGPRGLVKKGGIVVFASPFSWMEQFTARGAWLGGTEDTDGKHWSADGLQEALGAEFELVHRQDLPFMIREHRRKYEYVISDLTVWVRKTT
jgi:5-histidylcysteine sulfoxide synthase/putative 4-mercaptohistidine N1-methyltranferase